MILHCWKTTTEILTRITIKQSRLLTNKLAEQSQELKNHIRINRKSDKIGMTS